MRRLYCNRPMLSLLALICLLLAAVAALSLTVFNLGLTVLRDLWPMTPEPPRQKTPLVTTLLAMRPFKVIPRPRWMLALRGHRLTLA